VVRAIHHCGGRVEQRDLIAALDLARVQHRLLAVTHFNAEPLQLEQHRWFTDIHAERHVAYSVLIQHRLDLERGAAYQARVGRHSATQSDHAGVAASRLQPRRVNTMVGGGRAEIPQMRLAVAGQHCETAHLVASPLADVRASHVADVVVVEHQQRA